jgi:hypothetical protein
MGVSYQLGNLISSASSTIEAIVGERFPIPSVNGEATFDYGKVMALFMSAVFVYGKSFHPPLISSNYFGYIWTRAAEGR